MLLKGLQRTTSFAGGALIIAQIQLDMVAVNLVSVVALCEHL